jgi:hypothetical protein
MLEIRSVLHIFKHNFSLLWKLLVMHIEAGYIKQIVLLIMHPFHNVT